MKCAACIAAGLHVEASFTVDGNSLCQQCAIAYWGAAAAGEANTPHSPHAAANATAANHKGPT